MMAFHSCGHVQDSMDPLFPQSHLHVKLSRIRAMTFLRNEMERTYLVAVTGSTWQIWSLHGCYGVYLALTGWLSRHVVMKLLRRPRNCMTRDNHVRLHFVRIAFYVAFKGQLYLKVTRDHGICLQHRADTSVWLRSARADRNP